MKKSGSVKLPRLKAKDELLKTNPEIFSKLLLGEDLVSARSNSNVAGHLPPAGRVGGSGHAGAGQFATGGTLGSKTGTLARIANGRPGSGGVAYDSTGTFDEGPTPEAELAAELESVKQERQSLLDAIAKVKETAGTAGSEGQQAEIRLLLKELEVKKSKLNELKEEGRRLDSHIAKARDDDVDARRLTPDECIAQTSYIAGLKEEMAVVEEELQEAEAKNRLYDMLAERTRREHLAIDLAVRSKQEVKKRCLEDFQALFEHYNTMRASKEVAERDLAKVRRQMEQARHDWQLKIRDRRREVRALKLRQQKEREALLARRERQREKEAEGRAAAARSRADAEAQQRQVAALVPVIEGLEATWNRLRTISGADTPDAVIAYWHGLHARGVRMAELVALAEAKEVSCRAEIVRLQAERASAMEAADAAGDAQATGFDPAARIEEAQRRIEVAQVKAERMRKVFIGAQQGLATLVERLLVALGEMEPGAAGAARLQATLANLPSTRGGHHSAASSVSGHALDAARRGVATHRAQSASSGATSAGGTGGRAARDAAGDRRTSRTVRVGQRTGAITVATAEAAAANAARDEAASESPQPPALSPALLQLLSPAGGARGVGAGGNGAGIDDGDLFPALPQLLDAVSERLEKLLVTGAAPLDTAAFEQAAALLLASTGTSVHDSPPLSARNSAAGQADAGGETSTGNEAEGTPAPDAGGVGDGEGAEPEEEGPAREGSSMALVREVGPAGGVDSPVGDESKPAEDAAGEEGAGDADDGVGQADSEAAADREGRATPAREEGAEGAAEAPVREAGDAADAGAEGDAAAATGAAAATAAADPAASAAAAAAPVAAARSPFFAAAAAAAVAAADAPRDEASASGAAVPGDTMDGEPPAPAAPPLQQRRKLMSMLSTKVPPAEVVAALHMAATAIEPPSVPEEVVEVGDPSAGAVPPTQKNLIKGLYRRTWTGAPWLDSVSADPMGMSSLPSIKRQKGKKKAATFDVTRVMGYHPASGDVDAESDDDASAVDAPGADVVPERHHLKMRAAKLTARHNAKLAAAAQAAAAAAGR